MNNQIYMVFDVESVGLHGEGFAVGYVVIQGKTKLSEGMFACPSRAAKGTEDGHSWVEEYVPNFFVNSEAPKQVRQDFWRTWLTWQEKGAILVADCAWPVEARFLIQCVEDDFSNREWKGPYPLHDLASILLVKGLDPLKKFSRKEDELPEHNPLMDARQSARILQEVC